MTDRFKDPLEDFVDHAMYLSSIRSKPISVVRSDFERLIAAVYMYSRSKLLEEIAEQRKQDAEEELRKPQRL